MLDYCKSLPKIELHAHLNGSISNETLQKLGVYIDQTDFTDFTNCFEKFKTIQSITSNPANIYFVASEVINDFHKDNIVYLELRTTPRCEPGMTETEYVESVIRAMRDNRDDITVKLLLSLDRRNDEASLERSLDFILSMKRMYPDEIVGVDLGGDPRVGRFKRELFERAREGGLKVALHCAEVSNLDEAKEMLEFGPDRLGHCTALHPEFGGSEEIWEIYCGKKIPAEICLSSNVACKTSKSYKENHLGKWLEYSLPFTISTDDKGVFNTSLSEEYYHAAKNFFLNKNDLFHIAFRSIEYSFASNELKNLLKEKLHTWKYINDNKLVS